jgi:cytochrome b involved in lipid metabolism
MSKTFSAADVAAHKSPSDLWIIVDEDVYDLTKFQSEHPGGQKILTRVAGKDASKQFWKYHNEGILKKYKAQLQVGSLDTKKAEEKKKEAVVPAAASATAAPAPAPGAKHQAEALDTYGDLVPYADPSWYQGVCLSLLRQSFGAPC